MELHFERGRVRAILPNTTGVVIRNETSTFEYPGAVVLPGFVDNHVHVLGLGQRLTLPSLHEAQSAEECVQILLDADVNEHGWIHAMGWNQERWSDPRLPDASLLDEAFPNTPVIATRVDGHAMWVSAEASRRATVEHKPILIDDEMIPLWAALPDPSREEIIRRIERAGAEFARHGITEVHDMDVHPDIVEIMREIAETGRIAMRVQSFVSAQHNEWAEAGLLPAAGEIQRTAGIKLFADGAVGSRGAALLAPYSDDPDNTGLVLKTREEMIDACRAAIDAGWWCVAIHAIGDAAVRNVLDAYEVVRSWDDGKEILLRIEHAQHVHQHDVQRFADLNVFACVQPSHCTSDAFMAEKRLGTDRLTDAYRWRSLLKAGVQVAAGSDAPIESPSVLAGLRDFVRRHPKGADHPWQPQECLSMTEALTAFTQTAHASADVDYRRGEIAIGNDADVVVLDRDPNTCPPEELVNIRVLATFMAGQQRYSA